MDTLKIPKNFKDEVSLKVCSDSNSEIGILRQQSTSGRIFPQSDECQWWLHYCPSNNSFYDDNWTRPITMSLEFSHSVEGKVTVEGNRLHRKTETFSKCIKFDWNYLPYNVVFHAANGNVDALELKVTVEVNADIDFIPEVQTNFHEYNKISTDFEIRADNKQYKVHKDVLSKISPVFEAMLKHNFVETSSNTLDISDIDFKTIETAMNICYGRPLSAIPVRVAINILYFADKYAITDIFDQLEPVLPSSISNTNIYVVLRYAEDFAKTELFVNCAKFFHINYKSIEKNELPPANVIIKLIKQAFNLKSVFYVFAYALEVGMCIGVEHMELPDITTFQEFLSTVHYAWEYPQENLRMTCAKFWQENKNVINERPEYYHLPETIKIPLTILGCCVEPTIKDSLQQLEIKESSPVNHKESSNETKLTEKVDLKFELVTQV